jgi:hypothetical protein
MLTNDFVAAANPDGLKRFGADAFYAYYGVDSLGTGGQVLSRRQGLA